ncbi:MAG: right-handed parallel beta-helix repeat-containing protein [Candidatus Heimdallarchaeota archaeon]|nr:right-handed parallel beta-helix repeat-containing protein [Candidatus Heimdallarchaeota archaeon]
MIKTSKTRLGIGVLLVLLSFSIISYSNSIFSQQNGFNAQIILEDDLIDHPEIIISSDEDFGPSGYNFPGIGTPNDPYLIENYNITSGGPYGILIDASGGSTGFNVSFIIRNCWITAIEVCIKIVDAYPNLVTIDNCTCVNTVGGDGIGIHLVNCNGATVINCKCLYNFHTGLRLDFSANLWIENNTCSSNIDEGIFIDNDSEYGLFLNNTCVQNGEQGIINQFTNDNTFRYNNCTDNAYVGFGIYYANRILMENNTASKNDVYGFQILSSSYGTVMFNQIEENTLYGIYLEAGSDYYIVHHNNFISNNVGGSSQAYQQSLLWTQNATWYDTSINEGNYWNDWVSGAYAIDGSTISADLYPLNAPVGIAFIPEYSANIFAIILIISCIGIVSLVNRLK